MTQKTVGEITNDIQITPEQEVKHKELFKNYQPTSGISYLDRPNGLTEEEQAIIEARLNLKPLSSS